MQGRMLLPHTSSAEGQGTLEPESPGVAPWWRAYGWRYDPFAYLDAGQDPHLLEYLVYPAQGFPWQSEEEPLWFLAPPGGGKTALRRALEVFALQTHGAVAPVTVFPQRPVTHQALAWEALARALAQRLFWQALHYYGILPWHESAQVRAVLGRIWRVWLPQPPRLIHTWLVQGDWPALQVAFSSPPYTPLPDEESVRAFAALFAAVTSRGEEEPLDALQAWREGVGLLRESLGAEQVWVLLDGLDGFPETRTLARLAAPWQDVLPQIARPAEQVRVRAFLPYEGEEPGSALTWPTGREVVVSWEAPRLVHMLRARVRAASGGLLAGLDPLAEPSLRPVEQRLVEALPPERRLPREVMIQARLLLEAAGGERIDERHWRAMLAQYQAGRL